MKKLLIAFTGLLCCLSASAQPPAPKPRPGDDLRHRVERLEERVQALEHAAPAPPVPPGEDVRKIVQEELHEERIWDGRSRYLNIGYVWQKLKPTYGNLQAESDYGVSLSWGRTYYLHPRPLLGMVKIGLDWSWLDVNYADYSLTSKPGLAADPGIHQVDLGMSIGPSVTVRPVGGLKVSAYGRFTPSCSLAILGEETYADFAGFFNVGASVAWNALSVGLEGRWGKAKYGGATLSGEDGEERIPDIQGSPSRLRTSSLRLYLGFRF